tara:strand:+ start:105 stop:302 length:198 start_codon:yes stop_codon:yes gene_type:complete
MFTYILLGVLLTSVGGILLSAILLWFFPEKKYEHMIFRVFFFSAFIGGVSYFILFLLFGERGWIG